MIDRDPEADGATAGPRIRLDAQEWADGVWLGADGQNSYELPRRPWRTAPIDRLGKFWQDQEASWERQRQLDYWVRRWVLLALLVAGSLLMVAAAYG